MTASSRPPDRPLRLLISLHDVTPFHLPRLRRAEALFRELGLRKVAYLFVPEYHGRYPSAEHPEFVSWCRGRRPFEVQWHLHGYRHLESPDEVAPEGAPGAGRPASDAFKRTFLTAGEGEFLALDEAAQRRRLEAGLAVFRACLRTEPDAFVAPAWLFNAGLPPLLREMGIRHTEDHRALYRTGARADGPARLPSPVITWATRSFLRKYGSLVVCPVLARVFGSAPYLRVAMHPFDFDHASTTRNIRGVLERLAPGREQAFPGDLDFGGTSDRSA